MYKQRETQKKQVAEQPSAVQKKKLRNFFKYSTVVHGQKKV